MRLFVGVPIPQTMAQALEEACRKQATKLRSSVAWIRSSLMHVTLKFLGEVPEPKAADLANALRGLPVPAFSLMPQGAGFFPLATRPRVFWLGFGAGASMLTGLAQTVEAAVHPLGFSPEGRPFTGHLTLARIKAAVPGDPWPQLAQEIAALRLPAFVVDRLVLWQSILGPQGACYLPLYEFSLLRD